MIAKIIPLKRLPKKLDLFDYAVPVGLAAKIAEGQLVKIPFRKSNIFGLVFSLQNEPAGEKTKEIVEIVNDTPILNPANKKLWQFVSFFYGQSLGSAANLFLPPLQKRKLSKIFLKPFLSETKKTPPRTKKNVFIYTSELEHAEFFKNILLGESLILVPEIRHAGEIYNLLPQNLRDKAIIWRGDLSPKEQFTNWFKIRNEEINIVIGTRSAIFLPFVSLRNIIIDFENDENHKHWDQTPRYHAKDIADCLAQIYGCQIFYAAHSLSLDSYYEIHKEISAFVDAAGKQIKPLDKILPNSNLPNIHLIDMQDERKAKNYDLLSEKAAEAIINSSGNVLVITSRLGLATSIGCKKCGHVEECKNCLLPLVYHQDKKLHCHYCKTSIIGVLSCPKCFSPLAEMRGFGTETTEKYIRSLIKNSQQEIIRIDSELKTIPEIDYAKQNIVVGTKMAANHIQWDKFKTIILTDIDRQLSIPEFRANEEAWGLLQEILYRSAPDSAIYIQTKNTGQLIFRSLREPDRLYRSELNLRKKLNYPPYTYLVRYLFGHEDPGTCLTIANKTLNTAKKALTDDKKSIILSSCPLETQPKYHRGRYWYEIIAKFEKNSYYNDMLWLNQFFADNWKIDPNPISLLSPV